MSKRILDVWIVELKAVYRDVPFTVVTDWLQQGRLLGDDRVRPAGTEKWYAIGKVPSLAAFVPQEEPHRAEDQAEALEPVDTGFHWRKSDDEEDQDVDMIPLIDISLVLLIFFMMTAAVSSGIIANIKTPEASHQVSEINRGMLWVGIDVKSQEGQISKDGRGQPQPWYSLGLDTKQLHAPTLVLGDIRVSLREKLASEEGTVKVRIRADESLPVEVIKGATLELQGLVAEMNAERAREVPPEPPIDLAVLGEVSEPKGN